MTTRDLLLEEIKDSPEPILKEVHHYLHYLKEKADPDAFNGLKLSESALSTDWLSPEEEEAWKNL